MERKHSEHYEMIQDADPNKQSRIRLTKTPYEGVEFYYGNLKFVEVDGEPMCSFIYDIVKNPNNMDLDNDQEFKTLISDILDEILIIVYGK